MFDKQNYRQIAESSYDPDDALNNAFIGIAGIHDFKEFWDGLEFNTTEKAGELQVSNGFEASEKTLKTQLSSDFI